MLDTQTLCAQAQVTIDVEDLEADASPEDLMLSYVSGEKGKVSLAACLWLSALRRTALFAPPIKECSAELCGFASL